MRSNESDDANEDEDEEKSVGRLGAKKAGDVPLLKHGPSFFVDKKRES